MTDGSHAVKKIYGGMFGQEDRLLNIPNRFCNYENELLFYNGRSALFFLLKNLECKSIWIPSFLCNSVLAVINKCRIKISFYEIDLKFRIANETWVDDITPCDCVLFVEYFGFETSRNLINKTKEKGAKNIIDRAHSFLSLIRYENIDFEIFSPRKLIGIPFGSILIDVNSVLVTSESEKQVSETFFEEISEKAFRLRTQFDQGTLSDWYEEYKRCDAYQPICNTRINFKKVFPLLFCDEKFISHRRRKNFLVLLKRFPDIAIFKSLPDKVVPLGFPVLIKEKRDEIQKKLFNDQIYCPVHWNIDYPIPSEFYDTKYLSKNILTILCDQRISDEDISFISSKLEKALLD